jgi:hypothetical protein
MENRNHAKYVYDDGSRQKDKDRSDFYMILSNWMQLQNRLGRCELYATYSHSYVPEKQRA